MNDLDSRIAIIKQKIAQKSNLQLNPPIDIKEVVKIENYYEITLPSEYRAFITTIGNGGVRQNYGLLSLQDSLMYSEAVKQEKRLDKEFLKIPFTNTSTYNPNEDPYILELGEKCDRGEIPQSECYTVYDYLTAGTMTIFVEGCGYYAVCNF
jgi:hypothetical protein